MSSNVRGDLPKAKLPVSTFRVHIKVCLVLFMVYRAGLCTHLAPSPVDERAPLAEHVQREERCHQDDRRSLPKRPKRVPGRKRIRGATRCAPPVHEK